MLPKMAFPFSMDWTIIDLLYIPATPVSGLTFSR